VGQVKLVPGQSDAAGCEALRGALDAAGAGVRSVALEPAAPGAAAPGLRTAYVRLLPPPLPWAAGQSGGGSGGSNGSQARPAPLHRCAGPRAPVGG
jgi:hypothetical protein